MSFLLLLSASGAVRWMPIAIVGFIIFYILQSEFSRWQARIRGLPGPRGYPIVGSLLDVS